MELEESVAGAIGGPYGLIGFSRTVQASDDETAVISWITCDSREQRDAVNEKDMADPRIKDGMDKMPFDGKRMIYGGFETLPEM